MAGSLQEIPISALWSGQRQITAQELNARGPQGGTQAQGAQSYQLGTDPGHIPWYHPGFGSCAQAGCTGLLRPHSKMTFLITGEGRHKSNP